MLHVVIKKTEPCWLAVYLLFESIFSPLIGPFKIILSFDVETVFEP